MVWTLLLSRCGVILAVTALHKQEGLMQNITTIGLDLAKHVFQVHGMDHEGRAVLRKKLRRGQVLKFFCDRIALFGWDGSLWECAPLGPRAQRPGPPGAIDPTSICPPFFKNQ